MTQRLFRSGEVIYSPGDPSDRAYLIESGSVEILGGSPEHPQRVTLLGAGDVFGEMGLIEERADPGWAQSPFQFRLSITRGSA
ncbi:MAG: cyclic nucleotide-binding domain-containing protein [Gemmataceae bacterium]|nr:cyclic nucleotide-binding domain-containing protein [Gemmataceae bacterium]